jgi:hypothetical protein
VSAKKTSDLKSCISDYQSDEAVGNMMAIQTTKNNMDCTLCQTSPVQNHQATPRRRYPIGTGRHLAGELEVVSAVATRRPCIHV